MKLAISAIVSCLALAAPLRAETAIPETGSAGAVVTDLEVSPGMATETALTAGECKRLGGRVYSDVKLCKTGRYCGTTDEEGNRHRVCIEAKK